MAIIKCTECGKDVSSKAESCPNCGNPIVQNTNINNTGVNVVTTQESSKKFKTLIVISWFLIIFGLVGIFSVDPSDISSEDSNKNVLPSFALLFGFLLYLYAKIKIWWHHK